MAKENMVQTRVNKTLMPRSYIQYYRSLQITKYPLKTGQENRNSSLGLSKG